MAEHAVLVQFIEPTDLYVQQFGHISLNGGLNGTRTEVKVTATGERVQGTEHVYSLEAMVGAMARRCADVRDLGVEPGRDTRRTLLCILHRQ